MRIKFSKYSAAGNDFILIDSKKNPEYVINSKDITSLCNRHYGIGADGLLVITDHIDYDFEMEYYNSDGSTGMLCGNGARCIIDYADSTDRLKDSKTKFTFQNEIYSGEVADKGEIKFNLNPPTDIKNNIQVNVMGKSFNASFINTGAHHLVIDLAEQDFNNDDLLELDLFPVEEFGSAIRYDSQFAPLGTNVNFISREKDFIKIRTYERGVEKETLACGTGSVASAIISYINYNQSVPVTVKTKSGEHLKVDFSILQNYDIKDVTLTGPAKIVFEGEVIL